MNILMKKYRHLIIILSNNTDVETYVNTDEAPTSKNLEKKYIIIFNYFTGVIGWHRRKGNMVDTAFYELCSAPNT